MPLSTHQQSRLRDPSRTTGIQSRFFREGRRRWRAHMRDITTSIVTNDVFAIEEMMNAVRRELDLVLRAFEGNTPALPRAYEFARTPEKINGFMAWLEAQEANGILGLSRRPGVLPGIEQAWSDVYIESAYQRGIRRARADLVRQGVPVVPVDQVPGGVASIFAQPFHADRVGALYTRVFDDLKTVTQFTNGTMRRELNEKLTNGLALGVAEGKGPRRIARDMAASLNQIVEKNGIARLELISRTEVIRTHHLANIAEYQLAARDTGYTIWADWLLAANPCPICVDLEADAPYPLDRIRGLLPPHPRCACTPSPRIVGVSPERRAQGVGRSRRRPSGIPIARRRALGPLRG